MKKNSTCANRNIFIILLAVLVLLCSIIFIYPPTKVYAQNVDIKLPLAKDSTFATNGDLIAFTVGSSLNVAKDDKLAQEVPNAVGKAQDIAIVDNIIVLLDELTHKVTAYEYKNSTLNKYENEKLNKLENVTGIYSDGQIIYFLNNKKVACIKPSDLDYRDFFSFTLNSDTVFDFDDFAVINDNTLFGVKNNKFYVLPASEINTLDEYLVSSEYAIDYISCVNNTAYLTCGKDLISYNKQTNKFNELDTFTKTTSIEKIVATTIKDTANFFILSKNDLAVYQYALVDNKLTYVNKLDNVEYVHPTTNSIIKVAKATKDTTVYMSPITKISVYTLKKGDLILVLDEQDYNYYVTNASGQYGYIDNKDNLSLIEPLTNTKIGNSAQVLHPNTKMYELPIDSSKVIKTFTEDELKIKLDVNSCLAVENNVDLWGWYKISYLENGNIVNGYIKTTELSPYTSFTAPAVKKSAKIKAPGFGQMVNIYTLADESSDILEELVDGAEIMLLDKFDANAKWTKVQYGEKQGYILTECIQLEGLTSVQIFVITIVSLVVAATIIIVIIFCIKRKHNAR